MTRNHLILGGARSGKSRFAESLVNDFCEQHSAQKTYVATAPALDTEMQQRILRHQQDRDDSWALIEEPCDLAKVIHQAGQNDCLLIECLTLWLSNCLYEDNWMTHKPTFLQALKQSAATVIMVGNEVGQGIIPTGELSRRFVDESGRLHQELAELCQHVSFVTAGLAQTLKS